MGFPSHPQPRGPSWSILPGCVRGLLRPLFGPAAMLVDLDCGAVQHQGGLVSDVLGNQLPKNMLPYSLPAPAAKSRIYTFPRAIPFRQVPPGYPCVQPVQNPIQHDPVTLSRPSPVYRFSGDSRSLILSHCPSVNSCRFILLFYCFFSLCLSLA